MGGGQRRSMEKGRIMRELTIEEKSLIKKDCMRYHAQCIEYEGVWYRVPEGWKADYEKTTFASSTERTTS